ncbi:MAG: DNA translocase FtsK [Clostridia bacterium]|nr:DNA translocase FtsK [Clostridia bacterium]
MAVGSGKKKKQTKKTAAKTKETASSPHPKEWQEQIRELQEQRKRDYRILDKIWGIIFLAVGIFLVITTQLNTTGTFGNAIHSLVFGLFGLMAYALPYYFIVLALCLFLRKMQHINGRTTFFSFLIFVMLCILNSYRYLDETNIQLSISAIGDFFDGGIQLRNGGVFGMWLGGLIVKLLGKPGLIIFAVAVIAISVLLVADTPISKYLGKKREQREEKTILREMLTEKREAQAKTVPEESGVPIITPSHSVPQVKDPLAFPMEEGARQNFMQNLEGADFGDSSYGNTGFGLDGGNASGAGLGLGLSGGFASPENAAAAPNPFMDDFMSVDSVTTEPMGLNAEPEKVSALSTPAATENIKEIRKENTPTALDNTEMALQAEENLAKKIPATSYVFPPVDLMKKPRAKQMQMNEHQLQQKAALLENTLQNFHVDARVLNVTQGSSVTRYEVQPAVGVKVSSITKLADDIALNLRAKSIRIEAPIPGKAAVGIEVENEKPDMVSIRELIDSKEFRNASSKISFAVGKDISGRNVIANLKEMPHLLIAGATGSGKSVCINTIITSLLYKASPDEVKLILIDPKVVELGNYNGIPHLLVPVVTDPKKAAAALNWAVNEMTQRYKFFAEESVKDLDSYNELMRANQEPDKVLPKIVIIIDELADLMMVAPSQVEESICRLAQLARAAGMHLIVATQRPSVDVVTGLIKANIPSRIAFSVSSQVDSRTILDVGGAEKLLGKGDMLYSPVGENKPLRIQGPYISDSETARIIDFVKKQGESTYDESVVQTIETPEKSQYGEVSDELTEDAIAFILKQKKASVSMLQRRFRIGYNRAASIIDEIEARGIISPADGSKPRQVLYTEEEYYDAIDSQNNGAEETTHE